MQKVIKALSGLALINQDKARILAIVGAAQLQSRQPETREVIEKLEDWPEGKAMGAIEDLVRQNYLIEVAEKPDEDPLAEQMRLLLPSSLYAYFRTGIAGFLREFEEFRLRDAVDIMAEHVNAVNEAAGQIFFDPAHHHEDTIDILQRIDTSPVSRAIQRDLPRQHDLYSVFLLAAGQFAFDGKALPLDKWSKILKPALPERKKLLLKLISPDAPVYASGWLRPVGINLAGQVTSVAPGDAPSKAGLDIDRQYQVFETSRVSGHFEVEWPQRTAGKSLIYPASVQAQMDGIAEQLEGERFEGNRDEMRGRGMNGGLSVLMVGPSGTGKTACAQEWARRSGRALLRVGLASLRGKYMGESESATQQLFDELRAFRMAQSREPIVLLDEVDGFLHRRQPESGTDHPTETNLIAIFLAELQRFDGILIGTTNHTSGIDPAFHRRFLFTLAIPHPDVAAREAVLREYFPKLSATAVRDTARDVHFSPAHAEMALRQISILRPTSNLETEVRARLAGLARGWNMDEVAGRGNIGFARA